MSEIKEFARKTKTGRDVLRPRLENGLSMRFVGAFLFAFLTFTVHMAVLCLFSFL